MTLGPALLALLLSDREAGPTTGALVTFGRVPLFYYVTHLYLIQVLGVVFAVARYGPRVKEAFAGGRLPPDYGYSLWVVYAVWLGVVAALYLPCRWFAGRKRRRRREAWLSYL